VIQTLHTIALCYRDLASRPPPDIEAAVVDEVCVFGVKDIVEELTLIWIVGIQKAVEDCQKAGVAVKMYTGDNMPTAWSMVTQCSIFTAGGDIMEGPIFRLLEVSQMLGIVPRFQVLARSSPRKFWLRNFAVSWETVQMRDLLSSQRM
jgi:Ca2+-transporting ATPase